MVLWLAFHFGHFNNTITSWYLLDFITLPKMRDTIMYDTWCRFASKLLFKYYLGPRSGKHHCTASVSTVCAKCYLLRTSGWLQPCRQSLQVRPRRSCFRSCLGAIASKCTSVAFDLNCHPLEVSRAGCGKLLLLHIASSGLSQSISWGDNHERRAAVWVGE